MDLAVSRCSGRIGIPSSVLGPDESVQPSALPALSWPFVVGTDSIGTLDCVVVRCTGGLSIAMVRAYSWRAPLSPCAATDDLLDSESV